MVTFLVKPGEKFAFYSTNQHKFSLSAGCCDQDRFRDRFTLTGQFGIRKQAHDLVGLILNIFPFEEQRPCVIPGGDGVFYDMEYLGTSSGWLRK